MSKNDREFLILEYKALRNEILDLKKRVIQIQSIGITGIPILVAAGNSYNIHFLIYVSPLLTIVIAAMLMFEQNSIMRAGYYIRKVIEPKLKDNKDLGWERFLKNKKHRLAEKSFRVSVILVYSLYWIGGTILAHAESIKNDNVLFATIITSISIGAYCFGIYYYIRHFHINSYLKSDKEKFDDKQV